MIVPMGPTTGSEIAVVEHDEDECGREPPWLLTVCRPRRQRRRTQVRLIPIGARQRRSQNRRRGSDIAEEYQYQYANEQPWATGRSSRSEHAGWNGARAL